MARVLKFYRHEAIAGSWHFSEATKSLLCEWADLVIVMMPKGKQHIPERWQEKVRVCDVGEDRWKNPINDELTGICQEHTVRLKLNR